MSTEPSITVPLSGIVVRPGDSLILHSDRRLCLDEIDELTARIKELLPGVNKVLFLDGVQGAGVYRPDGAPQ